MNQIVSIGIDSLRLVANMRCMLFIKPSFRARLQDEFLIRNRKNPSYSLRSFAKSLDIPIGSLSRILNGHVRVTPQRFEILCEKIGICPSEREEYMVDSTISGREPEFRSLSEDKFKALSHWLHFAVLEVLSITGGPKTRTEIARHFSCSTIEVQGVLDRLERLQLVTLEACGNYQNSNGNHTNILPENQTNSAAQRLQEQILNLSIDAIRELPLGERDHSSLTFAMDKSDMERAISLIRQFRRSFEQKSCTKKNSLKIYQLSISLFPVSKIIKPILKEVSVNE